MPDIEKSQEQGGTGIGCALVMLGINTVLIGLVAVSFSQGPYSSPEQEFWYRYGSLALFVAGSILPAILLFTVRRSLRVSGASVAWRGATFLIVLWYVMMSGGGV